MLYLPFMLGTTPMKRSVFSSFVALASLATLPVLASGCGAPSDAPSDVAPSEAQVTSRDDEIRASCNSPRRYFVTYGDDRRCEPIAGNQGQWIPEALFDDAPPEVQASTCAYRWSGAKYSRPDREAIAAKVGYTNGLAAACGSSSEPHVGLLQPIPGIDIWTQAGSVGCDVCGVLRKGRVWVILPPEKIVRKQFEVQLSNGETRAFQIGNTDSRALSIELPAPPAGTSYKQGRVHLY